MKKATTTEATLIRVKDDCDFNATTLSNDCHKEYEAYDSTVYSCSLPTNQIEKLIDASWNSDSITICPKYDI